MKTKFRTPFWSSLAALTLAWSATSSAANVTWDANTGTTGSQDGAGNWNTANTNWWNGSANVSFAAADNVTFGSVAANTAHTVTLDASTTVGNLTFANTAGFPRYTIALGANTLTVNGQININAQANAYYTVFSGGSLALAKTGSTQASPDMFFDPNDGGDYGVVITSGLNVGTGSRYFRGAPNRNEVARYSGDLRFDGAITGSAKLQFSGTTTDGGHNMHFVFNADNPAFTGEVVLNDNADLALTKGSALGASNNVTFTTASGRASLFLFGQSPTIGNLNDTSTGGTRWIRNGSRNTTNGGTNTTNGGLVALGVNADSVLTIQQTTAGTFGGVISDGPNDTGTGGAFTDYRKLGIVKAGSGTLTLSGANTYTAGTTINQGTLELGNGGALGTGTVTINSGAILSIKRSDSSTLPNTIIGDGAMAQDGTGTTTFTGTLSATGNLGITAGNFAIASPSDPITTGSVGSLTQSGGQLVIDIDGVLTDVLTVNNAYTHTGGGIALNLINLPTTGTPYTLVNYGTLAGAPAVTIGGLSGTRLVPTVDYGTGSNSSISVTFTGQAADILWTGSTDNTWDSATNNWSNGGLPDAFKNLDHITFDDTPTSGNTSPVLNFQAGPGSVKFLNNTKTYTVTGTGGITGTCDVEISGGGTVILATNNNYTGFTDVLGTSTLRIGNGGTAGSLGTNSVVVDGSLVFDRSDDITVSNALSGTGALTKLGAGALTLTGSNSYAGGTTIGAGTLRVGTGGTTGSIGSGNITNNGTLAINRSDNVTISGSIDGTGALVKQGAGLLTLPTANTYGAGTTINGGAILIQDGGSLGSGPIAHTGGQVRFSFGDGSTTVIANDISLNTTGHQTFIVRGTADAAPTVSTTVRLTGKISGGAAGQTFRLVDSATSGNHFNVLEVQNAANDFQGTIEIWRGTLAITSDGALGNPENDIIHYSENLNGSIRFDADNITLAGTRAIQLAANDDPINTQGFTSTILGPISGAGRFVKQGTGRLILPGSVSHTGTSTVAEGTLEVDGTFTTSTAAVTVATGATLAGTGTIDRPTTVTGTIAPGTSGVGKLTTGVTTISGTYACDIAGETTDRIETTDLILGATSALVVTNTAGVFPRVIATYSGTLTGTFATVTSGFSVDYSTPGQVILREGGYASWAATNAGGGAANADSDGDGVSNGVEYFMGETGSTFTANPSVIGNQVTWPKDNTVTDASYVVQVSSDLQTWTPAPVGDVNDTGTSVIYTLPGTSGPLFVRLSVTVNP